MDHGPGGDGGRPIGVNDPTAAEGSASRSLGRRQTTYRRTLGTTASLVVAIMVNSATGFVFWWMAARLFPPTEVGLAGAAVSAMLLLSQISVLGLGTQLAGVLHQEARVASLTFTALLTAGGAGALLGLAFALAAPLISDDLRPLSAGPLVVLVFVVGVSLSTLASVLDQALVSMFRSTQQLVRNAVFSFGRLALLAVASLVLAPVAMVIYGAWAVGVLVSVAAIALLTAGTPRPAIRPLMWRKLSEMARSSFSHHVLDLSRSSSVWLLPLIVTVLLSPGLNASFYVAMLLANFIAIVGKSGTFTLYIVGARAPQELWRHLRLTLAIAAAVSILGSLTLVLLGSALLSAFGPTYVSAFPAVAILGISCLPLAVKDHWIAIQRVRGTVAPAAVIGMGLLVVELVASAVGAINGGLLGLAVARLIVLLVEAVFMAPIVYASLLPGSLAALTPEAPGGAGGELNA
jgi:O-antigen/teichoic acid export membrane protein